MKGRIDTQYDYQKDMPAPLSDSIRQLRSLGYAVCIVSPEVVGNRMHRSRVEMTMLAAGVQRCRELKSFKVTGVK